MGAILGVAKGSDAPPRFIIIEYKGKAEKKPIVFVGKGVTFDTGGLNLKPGKSINDMHMDMSGGAAVIHALSAIARLKIKKHVIGIIPAVENMPSGSSYRPGDVLRSMSGKTIEIGNTDAEGRVILSDALTYAERYTPRIVVDVATLTGAACVALGDQCSALFTKSDVIAKKLTDIGDHVGERTWRLPLWDEYEDGIKGTFADWSNVGKGHDGGAINGAMFLYQFAKKYPWVHLDIAPVMTTHEGQHLGKGASGVPVRSLVRIAETF
jgi:leucyl aminopeptidase